MNIKIVLLVLCIVVNAQNANSNECFAEDEGTGLHQIQRQMDLIEHKQLKTIILMLEKVLIQGKKNAAIIKMIKKSLPMQKLSDDGTNNFTSFRTNFHFNETKMNQESADNYCQERGMQLATLKTICETEAVAQELRNRGLAETFFWVSASDLDQTPGQFQWADGTPLDASLWQNGQPDDFGTGRNTCVYLNTVNAKLVDWSCSNPRRILCQEPPLLD